MSPPNASLDHDTIVAISTPPGRGGIGIVRLSGPDARSITEPLLRLRHRLAPGQARFAEVLDTDSPDPSSTPPIDEAVVTFFAAPHSYTTEDVVEIAAHGAPVLLDHILRHCLLHGARLASPGEFTQRAFLSGRLDLTQAEAVNDLISAQTLHQARLAAQQLGGALSRRISPIKQQLIELIATLEAGIDFAEDDIDTLPSDAIAARLAAVLTPLRLLEATFAHGRLVRDGFSLAIVGRPNTGKSSIFNRLIDQDRAIVTSIAGTTRDPVSEQVSLAGIPLRLTDTAGVRQVEPSPESAAEQIGIDKTRQVMSEADVVLVVVDATDPENLEDAALIADLTGRTQLTVMNKMDLVTVSTSVGGSSLKVSALTGQGIAELRSAILAKVSIDALAETTLVTNIRQHSTIKNCIAALEHAQAAVNERIPHEMLLVSLYEALAALDAFTGATTSSDILNLIFSTFCIGK